MLLDTAEKVVRSGRYIHRFEPDLEARFEEDTRVDRVRQIRSAVLIGMFVFNIYNITAFVTAPDWLGLNLLMRLFVVTPAGLLIVWAAGWTGGRVREALCAAAMLGANGVPIVLIALETGPLVYLLTAEIMLSIIFGSVVVPLRYSWAFKVSAVTALLATVAVVTNVAIPHEAGAVMVLNLVVTMGFTLIANRRTEAADRYDYLVNLTETLRGKRLAEDNTVLARLSATDSLTGLSNRRRFTLRLDELWRSAEHGQHFALILLDVDHFKRFNDGYGHSAGDDCLRIIADLLNRHAGGRYDLAARYGGEEFAVLLPGRTLAQALDAAERIRLAVVDRAVRHANRDDGIDVVTVSLGVATSDDAGSSLAVIEAADLSLYAAKAEGRNRTHPTSSPSHPDADEEAVSPFNDLARPNDVEPYAN